MKPYGTSNGGVKLHLEKKGKLIVFEQDNTIVCMRVYFLWKFLNSV